jgi:hypothetical protein
VFRSAEARFRVRAIACSERGDDRRRRLGPILLVSGGTDEDAVAALDRLSRHPFENGLYDRNELPEGGSDE